MLTRTQRRLGMATRYSPVELPQFPEASPLPKISMQTIHLFYLLLPGTTGIPLLLGVAYYIYIYIMLLLSTWVIFKLLYYTTTWFHHVPYIYYHLISMPHAPACQSPVAISPSDFRRDERQGQAVPKDPPGVEVERPELGPLPDHLGPPKDGHKGP